MQKTDVVAALTRLRELLQADVGVAAQVLRALVGDVVIEAQNVEGKATPELVAGFTIDATPALAVLDRRGAATARATPEEKVDALMATIDDLAARSKDERANARIRELVLRLGIFVGLEFEEGQWGWRAVRRLRRGVIAFGEDNLPVPIHGHSRADLPAPDAVGDDGTNHTHSAPAWCRAPAVDAGSSADEGAGNDRTKEANSGLEQTRQGINGGATADHQRLTRTPTTPQCSPFSRNTSNSMGKTCCNWR